MSIEELVGQMAWVPVFGNSATDTSMAEENQRRYGADTPAEVVRRYHLGGVLYFAWSNPVIVHDVAASATLSNGLQRAALEEGGPAIPLAITIDQEGGRVLRAVDPATALPGNMAIGASRSEELAGRQGEVLAAEMLAMGINVDFAPSLDMNTNADNPIIGTRSFGSDPELVGRLGAAQIAGMQRCGIAAAAKHFPGHGDTDVDSHSGLPTVAYGPRTIEQHLAPFKEAIAAGVDVIMSAHIVVQAIDAGAPATLSGAVLRDLLRTELGFTGLISTDSLAMAALKKIPGRPLDDGEIAVLAIKAGADILLEVPDLRAAIAGVKDAVARGELAKSRLEESVERILAWKKKRGLFENPYVDVDKALRVVGANSHRDVAREIAECSITYLSIAPGLLPLRERGGTVAVAGRDAQMRGHLTRALASEGLASSEIDDVRAVVDLDAASRPSGELADPGAAAPQARVSAIVYLSHDARGDGEQEEDLQALAGAEVPVIVAMTGTPYDGPACPQGASLVATYSNSPYSVAALAKALSNCKEAPGAVPVELPS